MAGIAGFEGSGAQVQVEQMLTKMKHRGPGGRKIMEIGGTTFGIIWAKSQKTSHMELMNEGMVLDQAGDEHLTEAAILKKGKLLLRRDPLGVAPLYYGKTEQGRMCFASEVKGLLEVTGDVHEFPPGHRMDDGLLQAYFRLEKKEPLNEPAEAIAAELRNRLEDSVKKRIADNRIGSWLSGGLDSSVLAALARPRVKTLYTFAAGLEGAPDLEYAREVAAFIGSDHREIVVTLNEMRKVLPLVIYHLESFDALLVRSSITNYLVAKLASDHVGDVFSGEGADELFAGYEYLKHMNLSTLDDELIAITSQLHNTALQRVDRSAAAHGTVAHVAFLDPEVLEYALRIPVGLKLREGIEKWILRRAVQDILPERVLNRTKAKFWEGAGVGDLMAQLADKKISAADFARERHLRNGWVLNSKEELMYYRIFLEHFGEIADLSWMGRTRIRDENGQVVA